MKLYCRSTSNNTSTFCYEYDRLLDFKLSYYLIRLKTETQMHGNQLYKTANLWLVLLIWGFESEVVFNYSRT